MSAHGQRVSKRIAELRSSLRTIHSLEATSIRTRAMDAICEVAECDTAGGFALALIGGRQRAISTWATDPALHMAGDRFFEKTSLTTFDFLRTPEWQRRGFFEDDALFSREFYESTPWTQRVYGPLRYDTQLRFAVFHGNRFVATTAGLRKRGAARFSRKDRRRIAPLSPSIRAALIAADALERASTPGTPGYIVVRPDGSVDSASQAGAEWLRMAQFRDALARYVRAVDRGERVDAGERDVLWRSAASTVRLDGEGRVRYLVHVEPTAPMTAPAALSQRQFEVATAAAAGASCAEIGTSLSISPETAKSHLRLIYERLGVRSRRELARALEPKG